MPPTPATCLPEGETGSEEEVEKGEKASSSSSLPSLWTSYFARHHDPWSHLCPGEPKTLKDLVPVESFDLTLPPLQFESEVRSSFAAKPYPEVLPLLTKSLPPVPPPTRNAPNFTEALLPPAPCWDSEPTGLELKIFGEDDQLNLDDVIQAPMPMTVSSTFSSVGSILHGTGTCKPCAWFWKPQGCNNGADCGHCHMCPAGESKSRRQAKMAAWRSTTSTLRVPAPSKEEPVLWRPPPGLEPELTPPAPVPPASNVPALGSVGSAKHSTGECTLCPDAFTPEGCPKGPQCDKCHLCAAEFRAVTDDGDGDVVGVVHGTVPCILCGTNKCSCPRIHSGVAAEQVEILAEAPSTDLPSLGSLLHAKGTCSPCAWVWKPQGCHNGRSCGRCHLCPPGEVKLRKKAKAREARHVRKEYFCSSY